MFFKFSFFFSYSLNLTNAENAEDDEEEEDKKTCIHFFYSLMIHFYSFTCEEEEMIDQFDKYRSAY